MDNSILHILRKGGDLDKLDAANERLEQKCRELEIDLALYREQIENNNQLRKSFTANRTDFSWGPFCKFVKRKNAKVFSALAKCRVSDFDAGILALKSSDALDNTALKMMIPTLEAYLLEFSGRGYTVRIVDERY